MPDVVGYRDYVEHRDSVCSTLTRRWETYGPDRIEFFPYPNGSKLRQLAVLRLPDLVALRAVGGRILTTVDPLLSDRVVSYRLESLGPAWGFRDPRASFARWRRRASAEILSGIDTAAWLTDVEAFFPSISHHRLMAQPAAWGCDMDAATLLLRTLATWSRRSGLEGLPIGPEISSGIGNAFLMPVDDALEASGFTHFRYVDDIVVVGRDLSEESLVDLIDGTLSRLGLRRSVEKTRYYRPGTALEAVDDALLAYLSRGVRGSREVSELARMLDAESDQQAPSRRRLNFALEGLRREGSPLAIASLLRAPGLLNVEPMTTCAYLRDFGVRLQPVRDLIIRTITETPSDETDALQLHCLSTARSVAWGGLEGRCFRQIAEDRTRRSPIRSHAWFASARTPSWSPHIAMEAAREERHPMVRRAITLTLRRAPDSRLKRAFGRKMLAEDRQSEPALRWAGAV